MHAHLHAVDPELALAARSPQPKSPTVLVVSSGAKRAVGLIKRDTGPLAKLVKGARVAKLFAKHMSMSEQADMLAKGRCAVAVGTPNRLLKLVESGDLSLEHTRVVVIDLHMDSKEFTVMSLPGVAADLMRFVKHGCLQHAKAGTLKLCLY
jgi:hypothetical protein